MTRSSLVVALVGALALAACTAATGAAPAGPTYRVAISGTS